MNPLKTILALALGTGFLISCGGNDHTRTDANDAGHEHAAGTTAAASEVNAALPKVDLDNGRRWKANPETTEGIANMQRILTGYDPVAGDAAALKAELDEEFKLIFERCTMTGESHDQLHNYLIPIHHALADLDGNDAMDRDAMATLLARYSDYFE